MECNEVRHALSARIDGEQPRASWDDDVIDAHLAECSECQKWYAHALTLGRTLRVTPAAETDPIPDFSETLLGAVPDSQLPQPRSWRIMSLSLSRIALILLGLIYVGWAIYLLSSSTTFVGEPVVAGRPPEGAVGNSRNPDVARLFIDAAAMRLALGFSLLWCSWRPRMTAGMIPFFGALWAFSAGFVSRDIVLGVATCQQIMALILFIITVAIMVVCWFSHFGVSPGDVGGSLKSLSARPVRSTFEDARETARLIDEMSDDVRRHVGG
ncbi:zf-HC2 domain-containing protein [Corynebacterium sp. PCR 32]|uniref:zf-HC2 domain-containing protein n=1 Tax=Corynebacterium sp. PCR 32 TaxID=3351342 RepID=UPI003751AD41